MNHDPNEEMADWRRVLEEFATRNGYPAVIEVLMGHTKKSAQAACRKGHLNEALALATMGDHLSAACVAACTAARKETPCV